MARFHDKNRSPLFNQIMSVILILAGIVGVFYSLMRLIPMAGFVGIIGLLISIVVLIIGLDEGKTTRPPGDEQQRH